MNFKHTAKVGSTISFHVIRKGKKIHVHENLHNHIGAALLTETRRFQPDYYAAAFYTTDTLIGNNALPSTSTFQQVGTAVTRVTGSDPLPIPYNFSSGAIIWPGNVFGGYVTTSNAAAGTATMSRSVNVAANNGGRYFGMSGFNYTNRQYKNHFTSAGSVTYANGVITHTVVSPTNSCIFSPLVTPYTLRSITRIRQGYSGETYIYDLPSPIEMQVDDVLVISSVVLKLTYATYQPVTFAVCPISRMIATGKIQKLLPAEIDFTDRMENAYFVQTANAVVVPDMPTYGASRITAASLTNPTNLSYYQYYNLITATAANEYTAATKSDFVITNTLTDIKQIYLGSANVNVGLFAALEFDTPQTFAAGKILSATLSSKLMPDFPTVA